MVTAASARTSSDSVGSIDQYRRPSVLIVGAGAAGLTAGVTLKDAGVDVTVLEARDRIGGRIHTVRFSDGRFANAGAEWINSDHVLVQELAARFHLELVDAENLIAVAINGTLQQLEDGVSEESQKVEAALRDLGEQIDDYDCPWTDDAALALDRRSTQAWVDDLDVSETTRLWFDAQIHAQFMVGPRDLSLASAALIAVHDRSDLAMRFAEGTGVLTDALASYIGGDRIKLARPVRTVSHGQDGIRVDTDTGSFHADYLILAIPLPALALINFEPAVDKPRLRYGRGGKLLIPYPERIWRDGLSQGHSPIDIDFIYESAPHQTGASGVLAAYGRRPASEESIRHALTQWFPHLGDPYDIPVAAWWETHRESGGTYSAIQPGDLPVLGRLQDPVGSAGRIRLAGEHTEVVSGYVESAARSGARVGTEIAERIATSAPGQK